MNNYSQVPLSSVESQFIAWSSVIKQKSLGNVFFLKNTGIIPRALQFAEYYTKNLKQKIVIYDPDAEGTADPFSFSKQLAKFNCPIIIMRNHIVQPDGLSLEHILQSHYHTQAKGLLIFHECAPSEISQSLHHDPCLYLNHFIYQLPLIDSDLKTYIKNVCKLWQIKLTDKQVTSILSYCGNLPWLINEAIRLSQSHHNLSEILTTSPSLQSRVKRAYLELPDHHKKYLRTRDKDYHSAYVELTAVGLISRERQPCGQWLIEQINSDRQLILAITDDHLIYNQQDLTYYFTKSERRILSLANLPSKIYTRDEIAELIYLDNNSYSDWALSQVISRLRAKLAKLHLPISIRPYRGKGYAISRI